MRRAEATAPLVIRDKAKQTQDVADLSRDAAGANPGLDKIFDKEKEQKRLQIAQLGDVRCGQAVRHGAG
ncbi:hypothetical protein AAH450_20915 [Erwinia sp. P7711]|uniref:hypothetical protein n=1 Tax=Erwinia sp. P7711 TaxID=3141451 RepID=UPI0031952437